LGFNGTACPGNGDRTMRWHTNLEGLWEKGKAQGTFQEMPMECSLARAEKALKKVKVECNEMPQVPV